MEKQYVRTALEGLKSSSSSRVQDSFLKIKSKIITNEDGIKLFRECGGLNYLVYHLGKPNERILGLVLSILGNCSLDDECRKEVGNLQIIRPLISVLKTVRRDSIVGRACRAVGNLAKNRSNAEELHLSGAVPALLSFIQNRDKNTSYPTLIMVVRALRQLWTVVEEKIEMLRLCTVRWIAVLLTTECESAGILKSNNPLQSNPDRSKTRKSQEELICGILKSLEHFTNYCPTECGAQVQGDGRGYECLIELTKTHKSQALRCLMNLCFINTCRPLLGNAGVVECVISIVQKSQDPRWWEDGTARMLALLSGEAVNRARVRRAGGLPLLLAAARDNSCALRALMQYAFDDTSFQILINNGLIGILIDEMKDRVEMITGDEHLCKEKNPFQEESSCDSRKRRCGKTLYRRKRLKGEDSSNVVIAKDKMLDSGTIDSDASDDQNEVKTSREGRERLKMLRSKSPTFKKLCWRGRNDYSPESGFSTGEGSAASPDWSPGSSAGPSSPYAIIDDSSDSETSGRYSPVCSEHELDSDTDSVALDASQLSLDGHDKYYPDTVADEVPFVETANRELADWGNVEPSRLAHVMLLLFRVATGSYEKCQPEKEPLVPTHVLDQLSGHECLNILLDYTEKSRDTMAKQTRILNAIFSNPLCLLNILKHKIPLRLHKRYMNPQHPLNKCVQCRQIKKFYAKLLTHLTKLAEAPYGIGEICYNLIRGPNYIRDTLAMTLPYVVQLKSILKKYYVDYNALTVLFAALPDSGAEFELYVTALGKLSTNVRIKDPKILEKMFTEYVYVSYDPILDGLADEEIVTFELDDKSTVTANRTFLCQNSDVFNAMLKGCFKESFEEFVKIKKVTKHGLEYLLTLLNCGANDPKSEITGFPMADKLETNLEVLLLADRFLFGRLKVLLHSAIIQFKMAPNTADKIYAWSLSDGMGVLCVESVAYILTGTMSETERSQAFRNILNLEYREQWLDDIKSVIIRHLEKWT